MRRHKNKVICLFAGRCKNYGKKCDICRWNAAIDIGDYLEIDADGKTVTLRYLHNE